MNYKQIICGRSGRGKTSLLKKMIAEREQPMVVVYDSEGEFADFYQFYNWSDFAKKYEEGEKNFAFDPTISNKPLAETFDDFLEDMLRIARLLSLEPNSPRILIVCDEMGRICGNDRNVQRAVKVIEVSRRAGLEYLFAAHRLVQVHPSIRAQLTRLYQFKEDEPTTFALLEKYGVTEEQMAKIDPTKFEYLEIEL